MHWGIVYIPDSYGNDDGERMNKWVVLIIVIIISIFLAEVLVRISTGIFEYNTIKTEKIGIQRVPNEKGKIIHPDFTTHYKYNSLGFRDREHDANSPQAKIVLLGDSFTEGLSVEHDQTFGYLLEQNSPYEVINFGLGGIGTSQSYFIMREYALKYNPDIIIYNFYPNDVRDNLERVAYRHFVLEGNKLKEMPPAKESSIKNLARKSFLIIYSYKIIKGGSVSAKPDNSFFEVFKKNYSVQMNEAWGITEKVIAKMSNEAKHRNATFIISIIPARFQANEKFISDLPNLEGYDLYKPTNMMTKICRRNNVTCIFAIDYFKNSSDDLYYAHDQHFNPEGHKVYSEFLKNNLK